MNTTMADEARTAARSPDATPRAARLFRSVVASSGLLLAGCGSAVVTARTGEPPMAPDAAVSPTDAPVSSPDVPVSSPDVHVDPPLPPADVAPVADAMPVVDAQALVDAALADARSHEIGWPTTKGVYCWSNDAGPVACCRSTSEEGIPTQCCTPVDGVCVPCVADDAGRCTRTDAAVESRP